MNDERADAALERAIRVWKRVVADRRHLGGLVDEAERLGARVPEAVQADALRGGGEG